MGRHAKAVKSSAYFSRFQVKYRRRREGKTDYRARLRLCTQDKNKYNTHKYRMVVRFSNRDITCQIVYPAIAGDVVVAAAYSHELARYGLPAGHSNWASAYATGLLLARRVLTKFGLADKYEGQAEPDGEAFVVEPLDDGPRPFYCVLDAGLKRTSSGSKIFGALKGALDGGLDIPHSDKRLIGYERKTKKADAEMVRKYIFGGNVQEFMEELAEEEPERYRKQFAKYVKAGVEPDELEDLYEKVHAAIRKDPTHKPKPRSKPAKVQRWQPAKLTYEARKKALKAKLEALAEDD